MWTGDIQSGYPTQWALNPSAYQNLPNEQVDWATLAQQWIQMKETFPVDQVPPAPPPPSIKDDIEAGEAPMDMSKDEPTPNNSAGPSTEQDSSWGSWNNWQQWGGWEWGGASDKAPTAAPPYTYTAPSATTATTYPQAVDVPTATPTATFDYNHGASLPVTDNYDQQGYWSSNTAPYVRNKSSDWRGESRGPSRRQSSVKAEEPEPDTTALFDAAKRKQLPAWIREGLEKMEREKQKKLERERQLKEKEEEMLRRKQIEEEALASGIPVKSKFETDSEESEKESEEPLVKPRKSRFDATSPIPSKPLVKSVSPPSLPIKRKSREDILQEVMQQVRYVLTDILMTVTNEEMQKVAEEVLADFRSKAPATQLRKTPALTSLTGKLGLGIYDSDSDESSEESDSQQDQKNGMDSDEELKERIHRKKQEFARIERDIEHQVEQQEVKEREREQMNRGGEEERDRQEERDRVDKDQVEPKPVYPGNRSDVKIEEPKITVELKGHEQNHREHFTPERPLKNEKDSSRSRKRDKDSLDEQTEDSDHDSTSKSDSSSRSSSSSRRKKSRRSSKKKKEKKSSKRKRKRSSSRGSEWRKSSRRKSGHSNKYEESWSRSRHRRSRSTSYRRHHSRSRSRSYSRSHSPDYHYHHSRGKKSSHRSRD